MRSYRIEITAYAPYPRTDVFIETASHIGTATARALRKMKKQLGRKATDQYNLKIQKL